MIILTAEQAKQVRGFSSPEHELDPRPLADGTFCLPDAVLSDPAHAKHFGFLKVLPKAETQTSDKWEMNQVKIDAASKDRLAKADAADPVKSK